MTDPSGNREPFAVQAAKVSLWTPVVAILLGFCLGNSVREMPQLGIGLGVFNLLLILAGFVLAIVALVGIRRHGREGILVRALIGLVANGLILACVPAMFIAARDVRARQDQALQQQIERDRQAGVDAVQNHPGWFGAHQDESLTLTAVSIADDSDAGKLYDDLFTADIALMIFSVQVPRDASAVTLDLRGAKLHRIGGEVVSPLPLEATLRTATEDPERALRQFGGNYAVEPGGALDMAVLFVPRGFDWSTIEAVSFTLNGSEVILAGRYLSVREKQLLIAGPPPPARP